LVVSLDRRLHMSSLILRRKILQKQTFLFPPAAYMTAEKRRLENELDLYKPVLLALVVVLACTGVWLLVLALTGTDPACHCPDVVYLS
jgi:hypothetical protein